MKEPKWVLDEVALAIHNRQLAEHGGSPGVRDKAMLDSALARPKNVFFYEKPEYGIFSLAAEYAYGIAKNHPFVDGNKRTAFVVSIMFLMKNGYTLEASKEDRYAKFIQLASGELSTKELAFWMEENVVPRDC